MSMAWLLGVSVLVVCATGDASAPASSQQQFLPVAQKVKTAKEQELFFGFDDSATTTPSARASPEPEEPQVAKPVATPSRDHVAAAKPDAADADADANDVSNQAETITLQYEMQADEVVKMLRRPGFQWVIACFSVVFGLVALFDGRRSFKMLVVVAAGVATFGFQVRQLHPAGQEPMVSTALYVAALEIAIFMGYVAHKGWEGMQVLVGFAIGMYLFHMAYKLTLQHPVFLPYAKQVPVLVGACSLIVFASMWGLHEKHGGRKVLGILAPIVGSSLVVSAISWIVIASCSLPEPSGLGVKVAAADVPAVIQFWNMIVFPMSSESVGIFTAGGKFLWIGDLKCSLDRIIGEFFWLLLLILGVRYQRKIDASAEITGELTGAQANLQFLQSQIQDVQDNTKQLRTALLMSPR